MKTIKSLHKLIYNAQCLVSICRQIPKWVPFSSPYYIKLFKDIFQIAHPICKAEIKDIIVSLPNKSTQSKIQRLNTKTVCNQFSLSNWNITLIYQWYQIHHITVHYSRTMGDCFINFPNPLSMHDTLDIHIYTNTTHYVCQLSQKRQDFHIYHDVLLTCMFSSRPSPIQTNRIHCISTRESL